MAVIECTEHIPCNPCEASCRVEAISVGGDITNLPHLDEDKCIGCQSCVPICPGQAIFIVDESLPDERAAVTLPHEFLAPPGEGGDGGGVGSVRGRFRRGSGNRGPQDGADGSNRRGNH